MEIHLIFIVMKLYINEYDQKIIIIILKCIEKDIFVNIDVGTLDVEGEEVKILHKK